MRIITKINYNYLISSRKTYRVLCNLVNNRISITINTLLDSRAYRFTFINTSIVVNTTKRLNVKAYTLKMPILPKGYTSIISKAITYFICFNLEIDRYRLSNIPFLILNLGN